MYSCNIEQNSQFKNLIILVNECEFESIWPQHRMKNWIDKGYWMKDSVKNTNDYTIKSD